MQQCVRNYVCEKSMHLPFVLVVILFQDIKKLHFVLASPCHLFVSFLVPHSNRK